MANFADELWTFGLRNPDGPNVLTVHEIIAIAVLVAGFIFGGALYVWFNRPR